jgi:SnoaL-like domain
MMRDGDRLASLFTYDGVLRMPNIPAEFNEREEIRVGRRRLVALWDFFVQTTHPGTIQLDGDIASGRIRSQINLIRAAADPRSRCSLGEQI